MNFNKHSQLVGLHAFLSASKSSWVAYDEEKLDRVFMATMSAKRGTDLHAVASECIRLGVKLPDNGTSLSMYVNDGIGFRMTPEQVLFVSENCFGTADSISFRKNKLRISDYKSGTTPTGVRQLVVYAAMFCLEYRVSPFDIEMEFRIYQNDECRLYVGDPDEVVHVMEKIKQFDKRIRTIREESE